MLLSRWMGCSKATSFTSVALSRRGDPPDTLHVVSPPWRPHVGGLHKWLFQAPNENVPRGPTKGCWTSYDLEVPECHLH